MSPRFYWSTAIIALILTVALSYCQRTRSRKQIFFNFCKVVLGMVLLVGLLIGVSQLLTAFGIAEQGFI